MKLSTLGLFFVSTIFLHATVWGEENASAADENNPHVGEDPIRVLGSQEYKFNKSGVQKPTVNPSPAQLEEKIAAIEIAEGPYSSSLTEVLLELAEVQFSQGADTDAVASIERGIYVARINGGPNSPEQSPLIERLVHYHFETKNWQEVDLWLGNYLEIKEATLAADDPDWVRIYGSLSQWALFKSEQGIWMFANEQGAHSLNPFPHYWLGKLSDQLYLTNGDRSEIERIYQMRKQMYFKRFAFPPGVIFRSYMDVSWRLVSYHEGLAYFDEMQSRFSNDENVEPERIARVMLDSADWHLKYRKYSDARIKYKECYLFLSDRGFSEDKIDEIINGDKLVSVSAWGDLGMTQLEDEKPYWEVSFNLSAAGKVSKLKIVDFYNKKLLEKASIVKKYLRDTRFRPKFEKGEPLKSDGYKYRIYFSEKEFPNNVLDETPSFYR